MAQAFDERAIIGNPTGFLSWFNRPGYSTTKFSPVASVVDINIVRGNERTAVMVPRGTISKPLGKSQKNAQGTRYTTFSRRFPLALEESTISSDQLEFKGLTEDPTMPADHLSRMRGLALEAHQEQVRRMIRLFERLAAQAILTGKQDAIIGAGADYQYDFKRKATHSFAASGAGGSWGSAASDVIGCIETGCDLVRQDAHMNPDVLLLSKESIAGLMDNTAFTAFSNSRRINLLQFGPDTPMPPQFAPMVASGWIWRGRLDTPSGYTLNVFTYMDTYADYNDGTDATTVTPYLSSNTALIGSSQAICDRYFGPPERLPLSPMEASEMRYFMGIDPAVGMMPPNIKGNPGIIDGRMFYFDAYKNGRRTFAIETQAAPIFVPTSTDSWVTITTT
jgi:hypothetical protein